MSTSASTVMALLERGAPDATALSAPGGVPLTYRSLRKLASDTLAALNAQGHRQKRPHRDRARQWSGNGGRLPVHFRRRHRRAFEPCLPCRRVRVLSFRPEGQTSRGRERHVVAGSRGGKTTRYSGRPTRSRARSEARAVSPWNSRTGFATRRTEQLRRSCAGRYCAGAAHLRHHVAPENRAAFPAQRLRFGAQREPDGRVQCGRSRSQHHAFVPHPRPDRRNSRAAVGGR